MPAAIAHMAAVCDAFHFDADSKALSLSQQPVKVYFFAGAPDEPWFQAKPVHHFLGATTIAHTMARVHEEDKASLRTLIQRKVSPSRVGASDAPTLRLDNLSYHDGKAVYVNESCLYKILLGSMKPEAESFQRWLTKEVLPSLRRTGAVTSGPR